MMTSRTRIWLCTAGAAILIALTWLVPIRGVLSQEPMPGFDASECTPVLDGYEDDGSSAVPGAIVCKYYKAGTVGPARGNWNSLWLRYYPSAEEATAWIQDNYLTDEFLKTYSCATWDDCDKIERALLEQSDSSFYGYTMRSSDEKIDISMQRRFVYGTYGASIFVQGDAFEGLEQAKSEVAALEHLAKTLADAPRDLVAPPQPAGTGTPGPTAESDSEPVTGPNEGRDCREYCEELDPPSSLYVSGETFPDCDCACSEGKVYFGGECASCDTVCAGNDKYTLSPAAEECSCLCKDPALIWDRVTGECVAGQDRTGMACDEYCDLVDTGVGWTAPGSGETYPDCDCWCDPAGGGATYVNGLCVPCQSVCAGDDTYLIQPSDGPCHCLCRDHTKVWDQATGQCVPAPDRTGMSCTDYCAQLGPGTGTPLAISGETYPDCQCQCQEDDSRQYSFFQNQCVPCTEMCKGEGMSVFSQKGADCACLCNDPQKKWDRASGTCVPADGTECNYGNGCQPELGENCANCPDCGCAIVSYVDPNLFLSKTCQPDHPNADIRGCVVAEDELSPASQLDTQEGQWRECRDAWALMLQSSLPELGGGTVRIMSGMSSLPQVAHWQQQCNCIPVGGVVTGNEAADPLVCLMRCCDRLADSSDAQEQRIKGVVPVVRGPGIKVRPPGGGIEIQEGQTVIIDGSLDIWGDRPNPLLTTFGAGSPRSEYEILHRPDSSMEVYLYEGAFTYTYFQSSDDVVKQEEIITGEMLSIGPDGVPVSKSAFDPDGREAWWVSEPYYVECPSHSHQEGADCFCDQGYEVDIVRDVCVPLVAWVREGQDGAALEAATAPPPLVEVTATPRMSDAADGGGGLNTDVLVIILAVLLILILVVLLVLIAVLVKR